MWHCSKNFYELVLHPPIHQTFKLRGKDLQHKKENPRNSDPEQKRNVDI